MTRETLRLVSWGGSLVALALNMAVFYVMPLDQTRIGLHYALAASQAVLIGVSFMEIPRAAPLVRIVALSPLLWLAILFGFFFIDYANR